MLDYDARTVRKAIGELIGEGFVKFSGRDDERLVVPLATGRLDARGWFPVPRFLVTDYLRAYPGSIVLIALLFHQHLKWLDHCWTGVPRLSKVLGIKRRSIYAHLNVLGHKKRWERLNTGLPWPLKISYSKTGEIRHFSVRFANFFTPDDRMKPVVALQEEFANHFRLIESTDLDDEK
jgi:hypothetical protein